jgi:hypothetical protein
MQPNTESVDPALTNCLQLRVEPISAKDSTDKLPSFLANDRNETLLPNSKTSKTDSFFWMKFGLVLCTLDPKIETFCPNLT